MFRFSKHRRFLLVIHYSTICESESSTYHSRLCLHVYEKVDFNCRSVRSANSIQARWSRAAAKLLQSKTSAEYQPTRPAIHEHYQTKHVRSKMCTLAPLGTAFVLETRTLNRTPSGCKENARLCIPHIIRITYDKQTEPSCRIIM